MERCGRPFCTTRWRDAKQLLPLRAKYDNHPSWSPWPCAASGPLFAAASAPCPARPPISNFTPHTLLRRSEPELPSFWAFRDLRCYAVRGRGGVAGCQTELTILHWRNKHKVAFLCLQLTISPSCQIGIASQGTILHRAVGGDLLGRRSRQALVRLILHGGAS